MVFIMAQEQTPFLDAHTHVQFSAYDADREEVISRAQAAGISMVNVGTQQDTSRAAVELAERYEDGVYAAIGLHPIHTAKSYHDAQELGGGDAAKAFTSRGEMFDADYYRELAAHPKVVAIGECGLDYFTRGEGQAVSREVKERQKEIFIAQIRLAQELKKPLMIHCRDAFPDLIETLAANCPPLAPSSIIHFFTGTIAEAQTLLDLGFSFTFGGVITFAQNYDEVVKMIPFDRILSETDAPYVAPAPYRGKRNEPAYVVETVKKLAELKGVSIEKMKEQIWQNAKRVFGIS
jgi:TatD DNase family protein